MYKRKASSKRIAVVFVSLLSAYLCGFRGCEPAPSFRVLQVEYGVPDFVSTPDRAKVWITVHFSEKVNSSTVNVNTFLVGVKNISTGEDASHIDPYQYHHAPSGDVIVFESRDKLEDIVTLHEGDRIKYTVNIKGESYGVMSAGNVILDGDNDNIPGGAKHWQWEQQIVW